MWGSSWGAGSEAIQQSSRLLVHRSYFLHSVSLNLFILEKVVFLFSHSYIFQCDCAPISLPAGYVDILRSMMKMMPSYLSRFWKQSMNLTPRTGTTSQIQVRSFIYATINISRGSKGRGLILLICAFLWSFLVHSQRFHLSPDGERPFEEIYMWAGPPASMVGKPASRNWHVSLFQFSMRCISQIPI